MTPIVSSFIRVHIKHITYGPHSTYSSHYSNLVFMIPDGLVSVKYWMIRPPNVFALLVTWNTTMSKVGTPLPSWSLLSDLGERHYSMNTYHYNLSALNVWGPGEFITGTGIFWRMSKGFVKNWYKRVNKRRALLEAAIACAKALR